MILSNFADYNHNKPDNMKRNHILRASAAMMAGSLLLIAGGCGEAKFKVKGNVYGAEDQSLVLEKADFHGMWMPVDSTRVGGNGNFSISVASPASPEIYRLALGDRYIYIPVDSTETLEVNTSLKDFGSNYTLAGSANAELMAKFEKELMALPNPLPAADAENFKRRVYSEYMQPNPGKIVSYYILTKTIDGKPLYDTEKGSDYRYLAAVATGFKQYRPDDPHTRLLETTSIAAMRRRNSELGRHKQIEAQELRVIDINLQDEKGTPRKLSDMVGKGKKVIVAFSLLTTPESPAFNRQLLDIYNAHGGNVEIYNVSYDPDQYAWRDAAVNLPWTTVYDPEGDMSATLRDYNVGTLPTFFIYGAAGDLENRASSFSELKKLL